MHCRSPIPRTRPWTRHGRGYSIQDLSASNVPLAPMWNRPSGTSSISTPNVDDVHWRRTETTSSPIMLEALVDQRILRDVGHNPPQEDPSAFASAVLARLD